MTTFCFNNVKVTDSDLIEVFVDSAPNFPAASPFQRQFGAVGVSKNKSNV